MDLDLADYDQVDEAKFFLDQRNQPMTQGDLLTTLSTEKTKSDESAICENDFVFLPVVRSENKDQPGDGESERATKGAEKETDFKNITGKLKNSGAIDIFVPHRTYLARQNQLASGSQQLLTTGVFMLDQNKTSNRRDFGCPQQRNSNPLTVINTNGGNNPFQTLKTVKQSDGRFESQVSPSSQPFWMRHENLANKPVGLLETSTGVPTSAQDVNHLSNLMHQIVTRSDSIYIAIPCAFCQSPKPCPPSDISAWLNHMNQVHNCKVCPICNRLVGLGPTRDIEIMQKHVVSHIDGDWLENKTFKTNFTTGLQNHWFSSELCSIKESSPSGKASMFGRSK